MTNAFTSLVRASMRVRGAFGSMNAPVVESVQPEMQLLTRLSLRQICGGDAVVDSPKGSWSPTAGDKTA